MANRAVYDVSPAGSGDWKVKQRSSSGANFFTDKQDAIDYARRLAKANTPSQVVIRGRDGQIQNEYTYEEDPYPPAG